MPANPSRAPRSSRRPGALAASLLTAIAVLIGIPTGALAAPPDSGTVTISAPTAVAAGATVTVTVDASAVADLFAYDLTITYDPAVLSFDAASPVLPSGGFDTVAISTGSVTFTHTRLGSSPGLAGAQELVEFTFTALTDGVSAITLSAMSMVSSTSETAALDVSAVAPVTTVVGTGSAGGGGTPTPSPSPSTSSSPSPSPSAAPLATSDADLAISGGTAAVAILASALGVALVALGVVVLLRRRAVTR